MLAIAIPTYNSSGIIKETLESIIQAVLNCNTTYRVYIFDDFSTDNTVNIIKSVFQEYPIELIVFQYEENVGETANVNRGFQQLALDGVKWAMLIHQDDLLHPSWLSVSQDTLTKIPDSIGMLSCENLYSNKFHDKFECSSLSEISVNEPIFIDYQGTVESVHSLANRWFWNPSGSLIRVRSHNQMGGWHPLLKYAADNDFLVRFFLAKNSVRHFNLKGIVKRGHPESSTSRMTRSGDFAFYWVYLMHKYLWLVSRKQRFRDITKQMFVAFRLGIH
ncbi:glycosyltransferase family 2 protein, partial [Dolichospermum circinale CS-537/05]|nr:glycosyltransferase family 2 protein [Dolichospermum circinale CS-537/05]